MKIVNLVMCVAMFLAIAGFTSPNAENEVNNNEVVSLNVEQDYDYTWVETTCPVCGKTKLNVIFGKPTDDEVLAQMPTSLSCGHSVNPIYWYIDNVSYVHHFKYIIKKYSVKSVF